MSSCSKGASCCQVQPRSSSDQPSGCCKSTTTSSAGCCKSTTSSAAGCCKSTTSATSGCCQAQAQTQSQHHTLAEPSILATLADQTPPSDQSEAATSSRGCPATLSEAGRAASCAGCPGQALCSSLAPALAPDAAAIALRMKAIKHKILVVAGKGGMQVPEPADKYFESSKRLAMMATDGW
jgi:Mrp family chromosome partitioning ATPase